MLAASPWRPPAGPQPSPQQQPAYPQQQQPAYPPQQQPAGSLPGYPASQPAAPQPQPQPSQSAWYAPPPPPNRRRPMSTGAVVGITLGSVAAGLVVLLVAVFAIASIGASAARVAEAGSSARPTPYQAPSDDPSEDPTDGPTDEPTTVEDYDVDGVHVHYVDGWTFELTAADSCAAATVTAGFADTPDGDTLDEWSTTVDFAAGVPVTFTIPDSASTYDYAGIESVQCGQA
nr:hypothetical protein [Leifsonia sp. C5G2]